jgi:hypothetical protein
MPPFLLTADRGRHEPVCALDESGVAAIRDDEETRRRPLP